MSEYDSVANIFAENVFSDAVMQTRLPKNIYKAFKNALIERKPLDSNIADVMANAMKDWALEKGATHYCHWFQPMTGVTAEKQDSFISPTKDGAVIMEFSGKDLTQGEPDASSFPSGGLRATFEARGYTAWDCTSPVFIKEDGDNIALYIPCAFCTYTGFAVDKKTPLLRSMDALNKQALRVLRALGNTTSTAVAADLGAEQEYFLVDSRFLEGRMDLLLAGRTLLGAPSPRGQELDDHYFGSLNARIATYMRELNEVLWKLGVSAKTQHNEVSPAQYEMAPVYATVNVATDHNQLVMEAMQKIAVKHDFVCLLHEKPFAGVNGSGKHVNWSLATDDGINLLNPGTTPHRNEVFLVFLCAVVRAVDKYSKLLRATVATPGNEHRLGANEAPPAIISIFLGEQLADVFEQLGGSGAKSSKQGGELKLGVSTLPPFPKDSTDRNRTSPFAFTGNKFEFRMPGSSLNTAGPVFTINAMVASVLEEIADELEKASDVDATAQIILKRIATENKRVVFNGDNYSDEWAKEAEKRGLANIPSTVASLKTILDEENQVLFEKQGVLSRQELHSRVEILLENYAMKINIEAGVMAKMLRQQILPAVSQFSGDLAGTVSSIKASGVDAGSQGILLGKICGMIDELSAKTDALEDILKKAKAIKDFEKQAVSYKETVIPAMDAARAVSDALEELVDTDMWPLPSYAEMLFIR